MEKLISSRPNFYFCLRKWKMISRFCFRSDPSFSVPSPISAQEPNPAFPNPVPYPPKNPVQYPPKKILKQKFSVRFHPNHNSQQDSITKLLYFPCNSNHTRQTSGLPARPHPGRVYFHIYFAKWTIFLVTSNIVAHV